MGGTIWGSGLFSAAQGGAINSLVSQISDNEFNIQACNSQWGVGESASGTITFTLAHTPGYVADTSEFKLEIYKDNGFNYKIASLENGVFISADEFVAGTMTLVSYVPQDKTVQAHTLHQANFRMKNPISEDGKIHIFTPVNAIMPVG